MENQDGGTAGMMIVLPLYERYVQINSKKSKQNWLVYLANDLTLKGRPEAVIFWKTFRHGFCHLGMPLEVARNRKPLPKARFSTDFSWRPTFATAPGNQQLICLDPWKFIHYVMDKYDKDPTLLEQHPDAPLLAIHIFG